MFRLTLADQEAIKARMIYAVDLYLNEPTLTDAISKLYSIFLPDTAPQQGDLMAEHILLRIREYDQTRANLLANAEDPAGLSASVREQLLELMSDASLWDQCQMLFAILEGMNRLEAALQGEYTSPKDAFATAVQPENTYTGMVSLSARDELLDQLTATLLSPKVAEEMAKQAAKNPISDPYPDLHGTMDPNAYRALLSASVYTVLLSGEHSQAPEDMPVSMDQVVLEVCRSSAFRQTSFEPLSSEQRTQLYQADWSAAKLLLVAGILAGGTAVVILSKSIAVAMAAYYTTLLLAAGIAFFSDYLLDLLLSGQPVEKDVTPVDLKNAAVNAAAYLCCATAQAFPETTSKTAKEIEASETERQKQTELNRLF